MTLRKAVAQVGNGSVGQRKRPKCERVNRIPPSHPCPLPLTFDVLQGYFLPQRVRARVDGADVVTVVSLWGVLQGQTQVSRFQRVLTHARASAEEFVLFLRQLCAAVWEHVDNHGDGLGAAPLHGGVGRQRRCRLAGQLDELGPFCHLHLQHADWEGKRKGVHDGQGQVSVRGCRPFSNDFITNYHYVHEFVQHLVLFCQFSTDLTSCSMLLFLDPRAALLESQFKIIFLYRIPGLGAAEKNIACGSWSEVMLLLLVLEDRIIKNLCHPQKLKAGGRGFCVLQWPYVKWTGCHSQTSFLCWSAFCLTFTLWWMHGLMQPGNWTINFLISPVDLLHWVR